MIPKTLKDDCISNDINDYTKLPEGMQRMFLKSDERSFIDELLFTCIERISKIFIIQAQLMIFFINSRLTRFLTSSLKKMRMIYF